MAYTILFSIQDAKGLLSTTEVNVPGASTYAQAQSFARELSKLIDPLISGAITRIGLVQTVSLPVELKASADTGADVEEGARFQYRTDGGFFTAMRIPTFLESKIQPNSRAVNLTDGAVAAFNTAMLSGIDLPDSLGTVQPCDKRDEDIVALTAAVEQFLSSRS